MKPEFFFPYLASLLFCAAMAVLYRRYLGSRHLAILMPYLILVFIQETALGLGNLLHYTSNNNVVYNIYRPVTVLVFFWIYYNIPFLAMVRKLLLLLTAVYLILILVNYCFIESIFTTSSYLTLARGFVIISYGLLFLFRYFHLDNLAEEKYWRPLLWITIGIIVFYPVISISTAFQKFLAASDVTFHGIKLYNVIPQVMSIFMYSCFSYAFYLCKKIN